MFKMGRFLPAFFVEKTNFIIKNIRNYNNNFYIVFFVFFNTYFCRNINRSYVMEELDIENILSPEEAQNLFEESTEIEDSTEEKQQEKIETTEINPEELFTKEESESVGSDTKDTKEGTEDPSSEKAGSSTNNFYSSIAKALKDEGVLSDLDDTAVSSVTSPEDFVKLMQDQVRANLDERQRRIDEALDLGVEPSEIKKYESTLEYFNSIDDKALSAEDDKGTQLRQQLIYQDFVNRGYSKERAQREVQKSFNAGTDIEDAKEALTSNIDYFKSSYEDTINAQKQAAQEETERLQKESQALKNSILQDKEVFGSIPVDKTTRQRALDVISKPVYKDPKTGEYYTELQKYELENHSEFIKNLGFIYALTDGFKSFDKVIKPSVKKEVGKSLKELEHTINGTSRTADGALQFMTSGRQDANSYIGQGWSLDDTK